MGVGAAIIIGSVISMAGSVASSEVQRSAMNKASRRQQQSERERLAHLKQSAGEAESARIGKLAMEQARSRRSEQVRSGGQPSTVFAGRGGQTLGYGDTSSKVKLGS